LKPLSQPARIAACPRWLFLKAQNPMPLLLFLLFVVLPIAEIAVFIEARQLIGLPATIILTLGSAFLGSFLVRRQGSTALRRFMQRVERGEMPMEPVADGVGILTAGVLLATPGFITDVAGLLLFIPPLRRAFVQAVFRRLLRNAHIRVQYGVQPGPQPSRPQPKDGKMHRSDNAIDAEFETIQPDEDADKKPGDSRSPWRKE
jgi:UPF0716 protein FxsA